MTLRKKASARETPTCEDYVDSIMRSRIRECSRNGELPDMDVLDRLKFKSLVSWCSPFRLQAPLYTSGPFKRHRFYNAPGKQETCDSYKNFPEHSVTSVTVRKAKYLANLYNCEHLLIVTRGYFDDSAISEAATPEVALIDRENCFPL